MSEIQQLSDLIGIIYDTAFDPSRWPEALGATAAFMNGDSAILAEHDAAAMAGKPLYNHRGNMELRQQYYQKTVHFNPVLVPISLYLEPGDIWQISGLVPADEWGRSAMFREFMQPNGWGDLTHCVVEKSGSRFSTFGVAHLLKDSPAGPAARERLKLLVPHVLRAVTIGRALQQQRIETDRLLATVDALSVGVFLLQESGRTTYVNQSGRKLLEETPLFSAVDGVLFARDPQAAKLLQAALAAPADAGLADQPVAIPLGKHGDASFVAYVVSLRHGARESTGRHYDAAAALFVHKAELRQPTLVQIVARQFGLTPGEARVLFAMLSVNGIAEAAAVLGIGEETVKTHLSRLYAKTGTSGQAELFKLLLGFANPIVG